MMIPFILITDSNLHDIYLSILKYHILSTHPHLTIFEHCINSSENKVNKAAAYILLNEHHFPDNTIFFIETNIPQKIETQKILLIQYHQKWIFTPDNGLIGLLEQNKIQNVYYWKEHIHSSFYSKNEMLNALKNFVVNQFNISNDFKPITNKNYIQLHWPDIIEHSSNTNIKKIFIPILYIDSYDNIILQFKKTQYESLLNNYNVTIHTPYEKINTISKTYNYVDNASTIALFNDAEYLEIASNGGKLASLIAHKDIYSEPTYLIYVELKPKK
ncbi:MAG: hypothetical protein KatS3mg027_1565 [Bacteroidia bacterium]|nr:MAG: hypothetical protein KatS3mg027_1565 [Bacteroidia bacterium]